ncbi:venom metalloproteinase antarease-like TtrivMP_A isoform X2 [Ornithodoros turicata]|uniref:venom metalloproteinase antarease-like TtrivMP_A isoform X2 n=1 Tax=Ornithodoros turicata TaxID=34597 RepID=UPI00313A1949
MEQSQRKKVNTAIFNLHEDTEHLSSVLVHELQNGVQLRGLLTPSLYIEPLYKMERSDDGRMAHKVYQVREDLPIGQSYLWTPIGPQLPLTVWIDVGIVSGLEHQQSFNSHKEHLLYLVIFMRSVTLRFAGTLPRIKFRLVGVYWSKGTEEFNKLLQSGPEKQVDGEDVLEDLQKYLNATSNGTYPTPDTVYLITKRQNITEYFDEKMTRFELVQGMAYQGGVCSEYNVAVGWDDGRFYHGVDTAVREIAHLLGAPWDFETDACDPSEGYVMGDIKKSSPNGYKFSVCSQAGMINTLHERLLEDLKLKRSSDARYGTACFDSPYSSMADFSEKLPGEIIDQVQFCRDVMPTEHKSYVHLCEGWFSNAEWKMEECVTRCCYGSGMKLYEQIPYRSMDGFKCFRSKKVCYAGQCVDHGTDVNTFW